MFFLHMLVVCGVLFDDQEGVTICGTTDVPLKHDEIPQESGVQLIEPSEEEVDSILNEVGDSVSVF